MARSTFREAGAYLSLLGLLVLAGCTPGYEELPTYRYRLTVEVATPQGVRSGSGVIEVHTWQAGPQTIPSPGAIRTRENGEAIVIDLGRQGSVFALMRAGNFMDWPGSVARSLIPSVKGDTYEVRRAEIAAIKAIRGVREVPPTFASGSSQLQNWPDLVRFADRSRPETIRWIGPLPPGRIAPFAVAIRRVTFEIVDAPVTRTINRRLPWLSDAAGETRLLTDLDRAGLDPFIPPLSSFDFTRNVDR
ncbi:hypothetical protein FHT00_003416 [Sphingomonas insulae]|uniref:Lipoprotein n=1 Tax=Sphingomonas insulae TaxID=424800 RepID=A0ABP3T5Q8_9SPHN|nr:hypothetical protein [Sphingomonas insulae]NIJ31436.1 hypothetical protein [Sphingomonas insulae]